MVKAINFDMDGTLVDFYGVNGWLQYLQERNPYPYEVAKPLLNLSALARQLNKLQRNGYELNIISWCAKNSNKEFDAEVINAKKNWLAKHLPSVHWDNVKIVAYGVNKASLGSGVLFDDEEPNRNMWGENAYDVHNILEILRNFS